MSYSHIPDIPAQMVNTNEIKHREFEQYEHHISVRIDTDGYGNSHIKINGESLSMAAAMQILGNK